MPDNMFFKINTFYNNMFFELTKDTTNELAEIEIVNNMSFAIAKTKTSNYRTTESIHEYRNSLRKEAYIYKKMAAETIEQAEE
ncbi:15179_t:CDS:2 [Cetraspora pellucida]|uniref:15179_t:CDS:1 n=1 Tax=Cetraspora pellucida TaxID=1433469 RepID=A0A9N9H7Y1_9GLOM|nr:15179_t:CDS:2 [Cetraspora pellucida]